MATHSIILDSKVFFAFLESCGFTRFPNAGREVVYGRVHHKVVSLVVKVYTSVRDGSSRSRGVGKDAIRVVAVSCGNNSRGLWKGPRVNRTGSQEAVQQRTLERMREAYARLNEVAQWL